MIVQTVIDFTEYEIDTMVKAMQLMTDVFGSSDSTYDMKQEADEAFCCMSHLLRLDPKGMAAMKKNDW